MRNCFLIILIILFASCSGKSGISKQIDGSDSLVIHFNAPHTNNIIKSVTTTETNAIKKLIHFTDGKYFRIVKCGYDGNLLFYKKGNLSGDISFNYTTDSCRHFIFLIDKKLTATTMSNEAADFLKSLAEGNSR